MVRIDFLPPAVAVAPRRRVLAACMLGAAAGWFLARTLGLPAQATAALLLVFARLTRRRCTALQPWAIGHCLGALLVLPPVAAGAGPDTDMLHLEATVEPGGQWDPQRLEWRGTVRSRDARFRLSWAEPNAMPLAGDAVAGLVRRATPPPILCAEDAEQAARARRLRLLGGLVARGGSLRVVATGGGPWRWAEALHHRLAAAFTGLLGERVAALLCRVTLGTGAAMSDLDQGTHAATGVAHLLAVSGFHAVLVAAMLERLLRWTRVPEPLRAPTSAALLMGYALLTGLNPPVVRAVGALLLRSWAFARGHAFDAWTALAATTVITVLMEPEDLGSASFLLSYGAVAGLLLWAPPLLAVLPRRLPPLAGPALQAVALSFAATLATAPVTLALFRQVAPWSILATPLLTLPVAALIIAGFGLGALVLTSPVLALWAAAPVRLLGEIYLGAVEWLARLPGAPLHAGLPPLHPLLLATAVLAALALLWRPHRLTAALACTLVCGIQLLPLRPPGTELRLLPVGHGLSCLVRAATGHTLLMDCGSLDRSRPERLVLATLRRLGSSRVDDLVVTHADADHAGAVVPLLFACRIDTLWLPRHARLVPLAALATARGIAVHRLAPGASARLQCGLSVHAPPIAPTLHAGNDAGLWIAGDLDGSRLLLLADQEAAGIEAVLAERPPGPCDVLLAPHHGRPSPLTRTLLAATAPDLVLVSDGWKFGTSPEERLYRAAGATCLRTSVCGEIVLHPHAESGLAIHTFLPMPTRPLLAGRTR